MIDKIISHYKILERIGGGGMGVVYKAEDTKLKRFVALKFLPPAFATDPTTKERFIHEAQSASALQHHNICAIHEIDETEDGQMYIVMDYYEGETLKSKIEKGKLNFEEAVDYTIQIAQGLQEAHQKGIIHRDIKPANIIITNKGEAKILDFGLAKLKGQTKITKTGSTLGTVAYMSPEQAKGEEVDYRTDIWSLGVVFYEMLAGQMPFKGEYEQAVIYSIMNEDPIPPNTINEDIPPTVSSVIMKMLVKDVDERLQSCEEVLAEFNEMGDRSMNGSGPEAATGISQLWGKKILQTVLLYVLASVTLTSVIGWLSDQILLSPYLTDFILIASLSMLPTVLILSWQRKKLNTGKWTKYIGITLNLLIVTGILGFLFYGKDLGSTHMIVNFTDDQGNLVNKVIPKGQFRKSVAIFPIENVSGDTTYNWTQNGIMIMLWLEFMQDLYVKSVAGYNQNNKPKIDTDGFPSGINMPLPYQRKISKSLYKEYFLTGRFDIKDRIYVIEMTLYKTENMKEIRNRHVSGPDLFNLIDDLSVNLRRDMGIPEKHIEQNEDWPISELTGSSIEIAEIFIRGVNTFLYEYDHKKALPIYKRGLQMDSTIASAYVHLASIYHMLGEIELRDATAEKMMKNIYRMPTFMQLYAKNNYYRYKGDWKQQVKVAEMQVHLFPEDYQAREHLANLYIEDGNIDLAVEQYNYLMGGTSDEGEILNRIGETFLNSGKYENALDFYIQYAEKSPSDYRAFQGLAETYWELGNLNKSKLQFEKALLLEPNDLSLKLSSTWLNYDLGKYQELENDLLKLLNQADSPDSRCEIYNYLYRLYMELGQIRKTINFWPNYLSEYENSTEFSDIFYFDDVLQTPYHYALLGDKRSAIRIYKNYKHEGLKGILLLVYSFQLSEYYDLINEPDSMLLIIDNIAADYPMNYSESHKSRVSGRFYEMKDQLDSALIFYKEHEKLEPTNQNVFRRMARVLRKLKENDEAEDYLKKIFISSPYSAKALYEMALVQWGKGDREEAWTYLNKALDVWWKADEEYIYAKRARKTKMEWEEITNSN